MALETLMVVTGILIVASVLASRVADWLGVPALLFYIVIGMVVGSDVLGWIHFDDARLAQGIGSVALAYILFSGGLDTPLERIRSVATSGILLSTVGVLLTALFVALPSMLILQWSLPHALLFGAIVASTDAAAVFSVLRGRGDGIQQRLASLLELESGSNDPMAFLLVVGIIQWMTQDASTPLTSIVLFAVQFAGGALIGGLAGAALPRLLNGARLQQEGLYPVLTISAVLVVYGTAEITGANPFLAVYLAGLGLGNSTYVHRATVTRFHDGIAWLMQVVMFLVLGLLAFPSQLPGVLVPGLVLGAFLMFIARPLAVGLVLLPAGWSLRESTFIGWVGLKGAVPIVLATFPLVSGIEHSEKLMPLVFFMVLLSTVIQGSTVRRSARWLGVVEKEREIQVSPLVFAPKDEVETDLIDMEIVPGSQASERRIFELDLPQDTLIVMVERNGILMVPRGQLSLRAGDHVQVLAHREDRQRIHQLFSE